MIKQSMHIYLSFLVNCISNCFMEKKIPGELNQPEFIPLYQRNYKPYGFTFSLITSKTGSFSNDRPVSLLPQISKVF